MLVIGCWLFAVCCLLVVDVCGELVVAFRVFAVRCSCLVAAGCVLLVDPWLLLVVCCLLLTAWCSLLVARCSWPVARCWLFVMCC